MTDSQLWQRLKSGDHAALKEIYETQIDFLLAYGLRFGADSSIVEDSVHDLFVYLWQNRETIGSTNKIRPYLATALRRRILKNKKQYTGNTARKEDQNYRFIAEPAAEEQLIAKETSKEKREKLVSALSGLSDREKEVLLLKFQHNLDYEDICKIMDINYQSVRNLVGRAIKKLRNFMELFTTVIFLWI